MKWMFGLIFTGFLFTACDNELVVTDKWKDIPIVWAFLSKSDTAVYIRVEKAFLDPNISADSIALIADSLYYPNAVVKLKRIASGQEYTLTRVDGNLEGYPREDGAFAQAPNYLYKIKGNIINFVVGDEYQFILKRNEQSELVTAETIILPAPVLRNPSAGTSLLFKSNSDFTFSWTDIPDAGIYDLQMRFNYREKSLETGNFFIPFSVKWTNGQVVEDPECTATPGYKWNGGEFYNSVSANIDVDPDATRIFESIDIIVWCGGKELQNYQTITLANTGITSTQEIPEYTNLSEGKGIVTSRNFSDNMGYGLHNQSLDSLKNGSVTGDLNFQ